jgi:hypothetical protein
MNQSEPQEDFEESIDFEEAVAYLQGVFPHIDKAIITRELVSNGRLESFRL